MAAKQEEEEERAKMTRNEDDSAMRLEIHAGVP
jgi:hypothetical protein